MPGSGQSNLKLLELPFCFQHFNLELCQVILHYGNLNYIKPIYKWNILRIIDEEKAIKINKNGYRRLLEYNYSGLSHVFLSYDTEGEKSYVNSNPFLVKPYSENHVHL